MTLIFVDFIRATKPREILNFFLVDHRLYLFVLIIVHTSKWYT